MGDRALSKIGGGCALGALFLIVVGSAYAIAQLGAQDVFDMEPAEALPEIAQHFHRWQIITSGEALVEVLFIPFWLGLLFALRGRLQTFALLGAAAGLLTSVLTVIIELPRVGWLSTLAERYAAVSDAASLSVTFALYEVAKSKGLGFALTALRAPRVGLTSLALLQGGRFGRWAARLGLVVAALTLVE